VARLLKVSGRHAQHFHDQEVRDLTPRALEFDEQWRFVKKKQKNCTEDERDGAGDFWDHTAVTADSKLMVSLVVGKRTKDRTHELVDDAKSRLRSGHLPVLLSDGYEGYEPAILDVFGRRYPAANSGSKGRPSNPVIRWPQGLAYGQDMSKDWVRHEVAAIIVVRCIIGDTTRCPISGILRRCAGR
jgi:hypothetical protein